MSELDPTPCNESVLADMAALAQQVANPVAPYPVLYSTGQCLGANFPLYFFRSNCPDSDTEVANASDNCLRVIDNPSFDPKGSQTLTARQVNVLPGGTDAKGNDANSIFFDERDVLKSFYVPPQYKFYFYRGNPLTQSLADAAAEGFLEVDGGQLIVDACLSVLKLDNGTPFFQYKENGSFLPVGNLPSCLQASCDCAFTDAQPVPTGTFCETAQDQETCPGTRHTAPYLVIVKTVDYSQLIVDMCASNQPISLGDNSLNRVWRPQTAGCDQFMTSFCAASNLSDSGRKDLCACFSQQQALNNQYGAGLGVSVCCFGTDPDDPTDFSKACFNTDAYKTDAMLKGCCSFAECEQTVNQSEEMRARASPPNRIECNGSFVDFPKVPTSPGPPLPNVSVDNTVHIPLWVWLVFGLAILLLVGFVVALAFVRTGQFARFNPTPPTKGAT